MQLSKLRVEMFKRVQTLDIELADVNVLVGANGSGKSSVIQAVHLACCVMRQADRVESTRTATVGVEELDYLPTDDYKTLGHGANWGNMEGTPASKVTLTFKREDGTELDARCTLRSARNAGISISGVVPADLSGFLRNKRKFFSAYIPGISGIPNKEERKSKKVILKACSFGDSNVILRNALYLLKQDDPNNIVTIERWIASIFGPITIAVEHDDDRDLHISCTVAIQGVTKAIELAGTGFLQLIQVFCYVLLFSPGVLLIDEPDIHLHPDIQEKLVGVLGQIAKDRGIKVLMTTHSPFIVRGAPAGTNVCWLQDGAIASNDRTLVEIALGWGAFGKKVIILSEDANPTLLRKLIAQWPEIDRSVALYPGTGYASLATPQQAKELSEALGGKFKIMVHRDRDSMTDAEAAQLQAAYEDAGVSLWLPAESDIEAYFCTPEFIELFLPCPRADADAYLAEVMRISRIPIDDQFAKQRAAHNKELHAEGGSPTNADVWNDFQARPLKGAKGKFVFKQLKNTIPHNRFGMEQVQAFQLGGQIALDLKHRLEAVLGA